MRAARLASFLQIRPGEARMVGLVAALFALIDAGRGFGPNAVDALFFRRFGVEFLPYMYIALGLVNLLVTLAYTAGFSRFDRRRFFVGLLGVLALILLLERAAILLDVPALYPVLWLTIMMLSAILGNFMWHLAGDVTDARQAKRLFSLFVSAGIAGSIVGNLVTGPAARLLGTDNLLILYALILLGCLALTRTITSEFFDPATETGSSESFIDNVRTGYDFVRGSSLLKLIATSSVLFSILYFSISFLFSQAVSDSIPDEAEIAGFLGLFSSIATAITLLVSLFVANRLYARIGVVNAVFLLPLVYLGGFLFFAISFSLPTAIGVRMSQLVMLSGIASGAYSTFFNVVPSDKRAQVRTFDFGVSTQLGTISSGVLLILGQTVLQRQQVFIIGLVVASLCSYMVWRMRRGYGEALVAALRAGRFEVFSGDERAFAGFQGDASAIRIALDALKDEKPATRRLAVEMLGLMEARSATSALEESLRDPDAEVRVAALRALGSLGVRQAVSPVLDLLGDPEPSVRTGALEELSRLQPEVTPDIISTLETLLRDNVHSVRAQAVVTLAAFGEASRGQATVETLLADPDPATRVLGLEALGAAAQNIEGDSAFDGAPAIRALRDSSSAVRHAACHSLEHLQDGAAIDSLVVLLADPDPSVLEAACRTLMAFGDKATAPVLAVLASGDPVAQEAALDALNPNDPALVEPLQEFARQEIGRLQEWRRLDAALQGADRIGRATRFICQTLETRAVEGEQRLVKIVGLLGNPSTMMLVGRSLEGGDPETRAAAIEALETLGDKVLVKEIIPLLEGAPASEGDTASLTPAVALGQLLAGEGGWMRAMAARAVGELALPELVPDLRALTADDDPTTREAAHDALVQLGEESSMETLQTVSSLERVLLLREVPLFEALTPEDLKQIADIAREELYGDGSELVREGDVGEAMFVIVDGQVRVVKGTDGDEELLAVRGTGDFIGEMALIEAQPRFATIRADGDVRILLIDANAFDAILRDRPQVARALLRGLSRRLREGH